MRVKMINKKRAMMWTAGKFLIILLVLVCLVGTLPVPTAHATEAAQATFTVKQLLINNGTSEPPRETFTYLLSPQTPDTPMPASSNFGNHIFTINGTSDVEIGPISFSTPGKYVYTLSCATADIPGFSINRKMYTIEVYISDGLEVSVIYIGNEAKVEALAFERTYEAQADKPEPPKPGNGGVKPNPPGQGGGGGVTPNPPGQSGGVVGKPNSPISGPKTGDFSNPILWISLIAGSCMLLMFVIWLGCRRRKS